MTAVAAPTQARQKTAAPHRAIGVSSIVWVEATFTFSPESPRLVPKSSPMVNDSMNGVEVGHDNDLWSIMPPRLFGNPDDRYAIHRLSRRTNPALTFVQGPSVLIVMPSCHRGSFPGGRSRTSPWSKLRNEPENPRRTDIGPTADEPDGMLRRTREILGALNEPGAQHSSASFDHDLFESPTLWRRRMGWL